MTGENPVCSARALLQNRVLDTSCPSLLLERVRQVLIKAFVLNQGLGLEQIVLSVLGDCKLMGGVCRQRHSGFL